VCAAIGAASQPPNLPGIHVAKDSIAPLGRLPQALHVVQQPFDLGAGEIGRQGQADLGAEAILTPILSQFTADFVRAGVLPDDGVVVRLARVLVPDDGRLALVRHADSRDLPGLDACLIQPTPDHVLGAPPDLHRIVLNPTRLRVDLLVL